MIGLLFIVILLPFVLIIIGIVQTVGKDELKRKKGRQVLLTGVIVLGVEFLIGYSICSNMNFH
jgi:uncharacterized membrane protein